MTQPADREDLALTISVLRFRLRQAEDEISKLHQIETIRDNLKRSIKTIQAILESGQ